VPLADRTSPSMFADTPAPPYYLVTFTSQHSANLEGYAEEQERVAALAREQPGYLGLESARRADGFGITVIYYDSLEAIDAWRTNAEHEKAKARGRGTWYDGYRLRIARVEADSAFDRD